MYNIVFFFYNFIARFSNNHAPFRIIPRFVSTLRSNNRDSTVFIIEHKKIDIRSKMLLYN